MSKCWQFNVCKDTPMLAVARLYQKISDDTRKSRFEPHPLPTKIRRDMVEARARMDRPLECGYED